MADLPSPAVAEPRYTSWGPFFAEQRLLPYAIAARDLANLGPDEAHLLTRLIDHVADGVFDADQPRAVCDAHHGRRQRLRLKPKS